jgi:hypothetical protein
MEGDQIGMDRPLQSGADHAGNPRADQPWVDLDQHRPVARQHHLDMRRAMVEADCVEQGKALASSWANWPALAMKHPRAWQRRAPRTSASR